MLEAEKARARLVRQSLFPVESRWPRLHALRDLLLPMAPRRRDEEELIGPSSFGAHRESSWQNPIPAHRRAVAWVLDHMLFGWG